MSEKPLASKDTIAAVATAPGAGGVGIVRISGPMAADIVRGMFHPSSPSFTDFVPRMLHHGRILDAAGTEVDDALAVLFPGPGSFTGEDCAEIQGHGGPAALSLILDSVLSRGARRAERGEFTRRAFLNGRMDLSQAEAVAELIAAPSPEGVRLASAKLEGLLGTRIRGLRDHIEHLRRRLCLAIDFPDDEAVDLPQQEFLDMIDTASAGIEKLLASFGRARCWQEGALVVLAGQVNAGKSSLMNALLGRPRAIVTEKPGTTRDYLEEQAFLSGLPVRLVDTAGLRSHTDDVIELEGMRRGRELAESSQCCILVLDGSSVQHLPSSAGELASAFPLEASLLNELGASRCAVVWNKADAAPTPALQSFHGAPFLSVSALHGTGIDGLADEVRHICTNGLSPQEGEIAPNRRQAEQLRKAADSLRNLRDAVLLGIPADLCGIHLEQAASHLDNITGIDSPEETLNSIFDTFCIGK